MLWLNVFLRLNHKITRYATQKTHSHTHRGRRRKKRNELNCDKYGKYNSSGIHSPTECLYCYTIYNAMFLLLTVSIKLSVEWLASWECDTYKLTDRFVGDIWDKVNEADRKFVVFVGTSFLLAHWAYLICLITRNYPALSYGNTFSPKWMNMSWFEQTKTMKKIDVGLNKEKRWKNEMLPYGNIGQVRIEYVREIEKKKSSQFYLQPLSYPALIQLGIFANAISSLIRQVY